MYIDLLNNVAITSTFLFLVGRLYQNRSLDFTSSFKTRVYLGIGSGMFGIILMFSTIYVTDKVILDLRHLALVIAAIFGGPISSIIAGILVGSFRILIFGISITSISAASVAIIMGILLGYYSKCNIPLIIKYIYMNASYVAASSILIYVLVNNPRISNQFIPFYLSISILAGVFIYYFVEYIKKSNDNHRSILYFKVMAENSTDLISTHHIDGSFKYLSPSCTKILGYEPQELIGKNPYDFYHPADFEKIKQSHATILNNKREFVARYRFKRKDEEYIWLETTSKLMMSKGNQQAEIICASRDFTDRKQVEEELLKVNEKLKKLSNLDGLTEIANRRSFDHTLEKEWKKAIKENTPISLILFDIDHFKIYNDTYGHQQGDECIIEVANTAQSLFTDETTLVARYGGEEFAIILPNKNKKVSTELAEELRKTIQNLAIPHMNSKVIPFVTISAGVSTIIPTANKSHLQLIITADEALYLAKKERNQVQTFDL
ncbi:diguanylate cyclase domain-containing protein [Bacillus sp. CGMCC 1.16607]|uniref:diguanylate cyclase domain-containing protein n=1 Tax=Bacillus sp. CGMCC 1.16607 TaxID=3351842 RepID=UPI00362E32AD